MMILNNVSRISRWQKREAETGKPAIELEDGLKADCGNILKEYRK